MRILEYRRLSSCAAIAVLILISSAYITEACSCAYRTTCEMNALAEVVFTGTIVDVSDVASPSDENEYIDREFRHRVRVNEVFRGIQPGGLVEVVTEAATSCSFRMEQGKTFFIIASKSKKSGKLWTGMCSGTGEASDDNELYSFFREGKEKGTLDEIRVTGHIRMQQSEQEVPAGKVEIVPESAGEPVVVEIGEDGSFEVPRISAGRFLVQPVLPSGFTYKVNGTLGPWGDDAKEGVVEVGDHGCTVIEISVAHEGKISGRLIDSDGNPLREFYGLKVVPYLPGVTQENARSFPAYTDREGNFSVSGLRPGKYVIGFNLDDRITDVLGLGSYPRYYHPGSRDLSGAMVLEVWSSGHIANLLIQAPAKLRKKTVKVRVVDSEGRPVSDVLVVYQMKRAGQTGSGFPKDNVASDGTFEINVFEDTEYTVYAEYPDFGVEIERVVTKSSPCVSVNFDSKVETVQLVLKEGKRNCEKAEEN